MGEGPHDIGRQAPSLGEPGPAGGVVATLARRVVPAIAGDSPALRWTELSRFHPSARKSGLEAKVAAAILISQRRLGLAGTICVVDRDGDTDRLAALRAGRERGLASAAPGHAVVCGVAVESIEAWTLGARAALATELGLEISALSSHLPSDIEALREQSGKQEKRPKALLQRLAGLVHRQDGEALRTAVAERTDLQELIRRCPQGFAPFAAELVVALATDSESGR